MRVFSLYNAIDKGKEGTCKRTSRVYRKKKSPGLPQWTPLTTDCVVVDKGANNSCRPGGLSSSASIFFLFFYLDEEEEEEEEELKLKK